MEPIEEAAVIPRVTTAPSECERAREGRIMNMAPLQPSRFAGPPPFPTFVAPIAHKLPFRAT